MGFFDLPPGIYPYKALFNEGTMAKVTGQVFKVYDKQMFGKTLYSVKLENDPIYYRMNENRGAGIVEAGNWIEFEASPNPDGKSATIEAAPRLLPKPAPAAVSVAGPVSAGGGGGNARETSIHYQSARKDAIQFLQIAVSSGAVTLPAKAAAKLKALDALVDYYTALYFEDISTGGAVTRATQAAYDEAESTPAKGKGKKVVAETGDEGEGEDDDE